MAREELFDAKIEELKKRKEEEAAKELQRLETDFRSAQSCSLSLMVWAWFADNLVVRRGHGVGVGGSHPMWGLHRMSTEGQRCLNRPWPPSKSPHLLDATS